MILIITNHHNATSTTTTTDNHNDDHNNIHIHLVVRAVVLVELLERLHDEVVHGEPAIV